MTKAAIFDVDGTLVENPSAATIEAAVAKAQAS